jgi:small subunit ribosomal protein S16
VIKDMAVRLRLMRMGAKKRPFYRIVAADSEAKRDGRFLEIMGSYDPKTNPATVSLDEQKVRFWLGKGAKPSETVGSILKRQGLLKG